MVKKTKVCIIVPTFNEEGSIKTIISEIVKLKLNTTLVVVDDGSVDNTKSILSKLKVITTLRDKNSKLKILTHPFNLGIGGAVQTGLRYAWENGYNVAIQIDGDAQHDPKYLVKLLKGLGEGADLVIGSRYIKKTKYKTPWPRLLGIKIFSALIFITCRKKVYDTTSGYRVFGKSALELFSKHYPQEFPEPRSIVTLLKNGYTIKEIPVETRERTTGQSSISLFNAVYLMFSISIAILFESFKKK